MCMGCASGAMVAVAGASGGRIWLQARVPALARPRVKKVVGRTMMSLGVLTAGVLGPSAHAPTAGTTAAGALAPTAVAQASGR